MITWKMNKDVEIDLPEMTEKDLEDFLADSKLSSFLTDEAKYIIRRKFKQDLNNEVK